VFIDLGFVFAQRLERIYVTDQQKAEEESNAGEEEANVLSSHYG